MVGRWLPFTNEFRSLAVPPIKHTKNTLLVCTIPVYSVCFDSDWLLNQYIVFSRALIGYSTSDSICYSPPGIVLDFAHKFFPHFSEKKKLSGSGYPLVWCILKQLLFTSVLHPPLLSFTSENNC